MMIRIRRWVRLHRKAWSALLWALACVFSIAEILLPMYDDRLPKGIFIPVLIVVVPLAMLLRSYAQKEFSDDQ